MNEEQIMINDFDVAECDFLAKEDDYNSYSGVTYAYKGQCMCSDEKMCKELPNCFYKKVLKQLKRKEQECEEWQAELADKASELQNIEGKIKPLMKRPDDLDCYNLEWIVCAFADEFNQLKKENEKLKKTVDDLLHKPKIQDKILWKIDNEALLGSKDAWIYKLEKTLTEIKEIAEQILDDEDNHCPFELTKQILQKCEVIDG